MNDLPLKKKFTKNFFIYFFVFIIFLFSTPFLGYFLLTSYLKATIYPDLDLILYSEAVEKIEDSLFPRLGVWYLDVVQDYYDENLNKYFLLPEHDPLEEMRVYDISTESALFDLISVNSSEGTVTMSFLLPLQFVGDQVTPKLECSQGETYSGELYTSTEMNLGNDGDVIFDTSLGEDVSDDDSAKIFEVDFEDEEAFDADTSDDFILEVQSGFDEELEIDGSVIDFLAELLERPDVKNGFATVQIETTCPDFECKKTGTECVINVIGEEL